MNTPILWIYIRGEQKTEKPIKPRKLKKNNRKNRTENKNRLEYLEKYPVRFGFRFCNA